MAIRPDRRFPIIALACAIVLAAIAVSPGGGGESARADQPAAAGPAGPTPFIYGARSCARCHDGRDDPTVTREDREQWICKMDEFVTFNRQDKHPLAFRALTGPRGKRMGQLLGADATRIEACVNCHSVGGPDVEARQYAREQDGVTCVACHGAYVEWVEMHPSGRSKWRSLSREEKERQFGMIDLWDPVRRAETCASCHIGDQSRGRVLTHAMYAAGHPPLPGLETATFGEAQPRHWETLREKPEVRRKLLRPQPDPNDLEQVRLVVLGGLVNLRESMKLVAGQAGTRGLEPVDPGWPDFARFDCYACHHDLSQDSGDSWRQARRRDGSAGRPMTPDWPMALAPLGIEADPSRADDLEDAIASLRASLKARPFGDDRTLAPAARRVVAWTDGAIKDLRRPARTPFDAARARALLDRLCEMAAKSAPDYDSARQIAWAFRIIYREGPPDGRRDPEIDRELEGLAAELSLDLPPSRTQAPIETALAERLKRTADYAPTPFRARFARIAQRLAGTASAKAAAR